jgi:hypothetical protein
LWVVENMVRFCTILFVSLKTDVYQMSEYWKTCPQPPPTPHAALPDPDHEDSFLSEFDRHCLTLLAQGGVNEEWQMEL